MSSHVCMQSPIDNKLLGKAALWWRCVIDAENTKFVSLDFSVDRQSERYISRFSVNR